MDITLEVDSSPCAAGSANLMEAEMVTTLAGLERLEADWRELGNDLAGPIEQFDWALACAESASGRGDLNIVIVRRDDRLAAVAPLLVKRVGGTRRRVMLGVDENYEPMDLLAGAPESLTRLTETLADHHLPIIFGRMPADSPSVEAIRAAFGGRGLVVTLPQGASPHIPLDASWSTPEKKLSSRRRSDLRRARRRAEAMGEVATEILAPHPDQLDLLLDEAFEVESHSWKGIQGTALSCDAAEAAFLRRYAHAAARQGILQVCFLRIGGQAVAMQVAITHGNGIWLQKIGYDARFASCSPGILLLSESIAHAAAAGFTSYEFLGQAEPWIEVWTRHKRPCVALRVYPYNFNGAAALATDTTFKLAARAKHNAKQLGSRLRAVAKSSAMPLLKLVADRYIAGDTLDDARRLADELAERQLSNTIGFWNRDSQNPRVVADQYLAGLDLLAGYEPGAYLSIKLPALCFSQSLLQEVVDRSSATGRRVHLDSLGPEVADRTRAMVEEALASAPAADIGYTLPGRWQRSLTDARWAAERGLFVRVVKGEWPDPADEHRDPHEGYLEVIDQLAGHAARVGVATHNPVLANEAVRRLQAAGTPCEVELLYGLPMRDAVAEARKLGVKVRVYVPYGEAYLPYALSQVHRKPRIVWWLAKDIAASLFTGKK